jgi:excisionase family DNA binding protein
MRQHRLVRQGGNVPKTKKTSSFVTKSLPATQVNDDADYATVGSAAKLVGVSHDHIRHLFTQKKLTRFKFGARTLVKKSELFGLVRKAE